MHSAEFKKITKIVCLSILINCDINTLLDSLIKAERTDTMVDISNHHRKV